MYIQMKPHRSFDGLRSFVFLLSDSCLRGYAMSTHKIFTGNHMGWILTGVILALFAQASIIKKAGLGR